MGDKVSEGTLVLTLDTGAAGDAKPAAQTAAPSPPPAASLPAAAPAAQPPSPMAPPAPSASAAPAAAAAVDEAAFRQAHASPSVRKFARELGVDLARVKGTGPRARILQEDVQNFVKQALSGAAATGSAAAGGGISGGGSLNLLPWPTLDFAKFGAIETKPLSRIKKISGANLARNWVMIPHVTQFDDADITDLEAFRVQMNKENEKTGVKITMLAFLIKASVAALRKFPDFNASLVSAPDGDSLVLKQYFHIGFAADTPNGLVVPVIRNADQKGCFSISSLGGIGGTAFTPIINAPEVAILGVSKSAMKPVWNGREFAPRLMMPLSLSYDHRVIDGASAARFTAFLANLLADMRRVVL